jgi:hypothetical protein
MAFGFFSSAALALRDAPVLPRALRKACRPGGDVNWSVRIETFGDEAIATFFLHGVTCGKEFEINRKGGIDLANKLTMRRPGAT